MAGGRPLRLLPNSSGLIPELSQSARAELGLLDVDSSGGPGPYCESASRHPASLAKPKAQPSHRVASQGCVQQVDFSKQSEELLRSMVSNTAAAAQCDDHSKVTAQDVSSLRASQPDRAAAVGVLERSEARRQRDAIVPKRANGNASLQAAREALPVWEHREEILRAVHRHQIVIVEGETGCGKTTQVGQYIVDDACKKDCPCSVVCTQPRRISAITVADRVADERGERVGDSVGYSVRLESKAGPNTSLLFCTTGILLRRLESDRELEGATHILVDEVHERGVESDFLLLALRDLCRRRTDLKVVLMSATMDKALFGRYFGGAPSITVPGRLFPVQDLFLEDVLDATGHVLNTAADWAIGGNVKGKGKGKGAEQCEREQLDAKKREDFSDLASRSRYSRLAPTAQKALRGLEQDAVNYELLAQLIQGDTLSRLDKEQVIARRRCVLVFMSGAKEIETLQEALVKTEEFMSPLARTWLLPLHGGLPTEDQRKVFQKPPAGVRKVVIATNVAETSVTIDDIGYVVDTCRMKEMRHDAIRCMSSLEDTVVSRTNARQRRGRAGRVAPGLCVHLGLTRYRHEHLIDDHQPPEVQRTPLEQLVLRIHAAKLHLRDASGKAASICARLLEPPNPAFVAKAVQQLVRLGALELDADGRESLTALGDHLAHLPLEARLGKLALFGAAFGPAATDAALTVAAALTSRSPFLAPLEAREETRKAKKKFADRMIVGPVGLSDHMAVLAAYREWDGLPNRGDERYDFCRANFLSIKTLQGMAELKQSLLETLSQAGFVRRGLRAKDVAGAGRMRNGSDGVLLAIAQGFTVEPCPPALVAALLCAALFPQVATVTMPQVDKPKKWKANTNDDGPKPKLLVRDAETGGPLMVKLHPGSVSAKQTRLSSPYLVYQELTKSEFCVYARDVTPVPPLALVLFGSSLSAGMGQSSWGSAELVVDGWIKLAVPANLRELLLMTRRRLDDLLARWVGRRREGGEACIQDRESEELLKAIVQLLSLQEECVPEAPARNPQQVAFNANGKHAQRGSKRGVQGSNSGKQAGSFANFWGGAAKRRRR